MALQLGAAVLLNLGFACLLGCSLARHWMRSSGVVDPDCEAALRRVEIVAASLGVVGSAAGLLAAAAAMAGVGLRQAAAVFWPMLRATDYGRAGSVMLLAMVAAFFFICLARASAPQARSGAIGSVVALLIFAVTRASMGHAGEQGLWSLTVAADAVHLWAVGVWMGAVMVSAWCMLKRSVAGN